MPRRAAITTLYPPSAPASVAHVVNSSESVFNVSNRAAMKPASAAMSADQNRSRVGRDRRRSATPAAMHATVVPIATGSPAIGGSSAVAPHPTSSHAGALAHNGRYEPGTTCSRSSSACSAQLLPVLSSSGFTLRSILVGAARHSQAGSLRR